MIPYRLSAPNLFSLCRRTKTPSTTSNSSNNTDFVFSLRIVGEQNLKFGAYIYTAAGGVDSSQTFVGLAKGKHSVDLSREFTILFNVNDNNKTIEKHAWSAPINGDIEIEEDVLEPPHTGVSSVDYIIVNNVMFIERKKELLTF